MIYNKLYSKGIIVILAICAVSVLSSCLKDLDTIPLDKEEITAANVFQNETAYRQALAKIYAGLALSGQEGPAGKADISGIDEGFSTYLRQYWKAQELSTDEAVTGWEDDGLKDYNSHTWTASNQFVTAMYNRIFYQVTLCNEFIRESSDANLEQRNIADKATIKGYQTEARFMRALSYWHGLDMFANIPFVTEEDKIGSFLPEQTNPNALFNYIEEELLSIESELVDPKTNEYGRADKAVAWILLAKLYLNAEVYIDTDRSADCITYCNKIIQSNAYSLEGNYEHLFLADNNQSNEIIFAVNFDGEASKTWGGMTFLVHAAVGGSMDPVVFGIDGGWGGLRTTPEFVNHFDASLTTDSRAMFHTDGQTLEIDDIELFTDGYTITKYKNVTRDAMPGADKTFPDIDFPMFRLADVYLMYAEAVKRGGGGSEGEAINYINALRERAYGDNSGNISSYDLDFVLDERARELYWEGHRRTDLIRYNKFTGGNYLWAWKGNIKSGVSTPNHLDLFPIPADDLIANPNLDQNSGY